MAAETKSEQLDLFAEDQAAAAVELEAPEAAARRLELQRLSPDERVQGLLNIGQLREQLAGGASVAYIPSRPCRCGGTEAELSQTGTQLPVRCTACGKVFYNAPRGEVGFEPRTVRTLRRDVSPGQQARILDRDHGRCVLCGTADFLTIGHLLSLADGKKVGATADELADDANLASMCEGCNAGLGGRSVSLLTATLMHHILQAERMRRPVTVR